MNKARAFTLLEVLVSMTVLSVAILGLIQGYSLSVQAGAQATRMEEAAALAQAKLSEATGPDGQDGQGRQGCFGWVTKITDVKSSLKLASVEVKWLERGQATTVRLSQIFLPAEGEGK